MPRQPPTIKRWEIAAAFAALAASYFVGLWALHIADVKTHRLALNAHALAAQVSKTAKATRRLRAEQLERLHAAAVANCLGRHEQNVILRSLVDRSIAQEKTLRLPGLTPAQQHVIDSARAASLASLTRFLRDLRRSDCLSVPALPTRQ